MDITIPIEKYNFLADYGADFFKDTYPTMWKNVCLLVEEKYAQEIKDRVVNKEMDLMRAKMLDSVEKETEYEALIWKYDYMNALINSEKYDMAMKIMKKQLRELRKLEFNGSTYILTDDEKREIDAEIKRKAKEKYVTVIDKNDIYAKIDTLERVSIFQYKKGPKYNINTAMNVTYRRHLTEREYEIIELCAKAGLHYKWIAKLFGMEDRFMNTTCKKLGYDNVFVTPQKLMKTLPRIKVLDTSGFFVIEKENHLIKLKNI